MSLLQYKNLTCCAFVEINGVEDVNDPKESLLDLCKHIWPETRINYGEKATPSAFYLIHGVVGVVEDDDDYWNDYNDDTLGAVERLADYIKKHKLGIIIAGPTRKNRVNEPLHKVRGYIWAPSESGLWIWFQENRDEKSKEKYKAKVAETRTANYGMNTFYR